MSNTNINGRLLASRIIMLRCAVSLHGTARPDITAGLGVESFGGTVCTDSCAIHLPVEIDTVLGGGLRVDRSCPAFNSFNTTIPSSSQTRDHLARHLLWSCSYLMAWLSV